MGWSEKNEKEGKEGLRVGKVALVWEPYHFGN